MNSKVYVAVTVEFSTEGQLRPLTIIWENGQVYTIDRVLDVRPSTTPPFGTSGLRYTCRIGQKKAYLFCENDRWFVQRKAVHS